MVVTNNRVTREARLYARRLGVEIIGDAEWEEIKQTIKDKKATNPNIHKGLLGLIIVHILASAGNQQSEEYLQAILSGTEPDYNYDDSEELVLKIQSEFEEADEFIKESARLFQRATESQQKAMSIHYQASQIWLKGKR